MRGSFTLPWLEDERKHYLAMVEKKDLDYKKLHQQGMCKLIHFTCSDSLHMYDIRLLKARVITLWGCYAQCFAHRREDTHRR